MVKTLSLLDRFVECVLALIVSVMVVVAGTHVVCRYVLSYSLTWSEELLRYALTWLVFLGIGVGLRRRSHMGMDFVVKKCSVNVQTVFGMLVSIAATIFGGVVVYYTLAMIQVAAHQITPALGISMSLVYYGLAFGGLYTSVVGIRYFAVEAKALGQQKRGES